SSDIEKLPSSCSEMNRRFSAPASFQPMVTPASRCHPCLRTICHRCPRAVHPGPLPRKQGRGSVKDASQLTFPPPCLRGGGPGGWGGAGDVMDRSQGDPV